MSEWINHAMATRADALKLIRGYPVNTRFHMHVALDGDTPAEPGKYLPDAFMGSIKISRDIAERFIQGAFSETLERRGVVLKISESVGDRRKRWNEQAGTMAEYGEPLRWVYLG